MSKKKTYDEFLSQVISIHGDKFVYDKSSYVNTHTKMKIYCKKHGWFEQTPKAHLSYGCNKCAIELRANKNRYTTEEFINKSKLIHGDTYGYDKVIYKGIRIPVIIECKKHGLFEQVPMNHLRGKGCPLCNESSIERDVKKYLTDNKIEFKYQYKRNWLGKMSIDFVIGDLMIECQGKQHLGFGGWSLSFDFKEQYDRDKKKNKLVTEQGKKLFYIVPAKLKKYAIENFDLYNKENTFVNIEEILKIYENVK